MRGHLEGLQLLGPLDPNEGALTPLFQSNIDEGMLREIAEADYGWKADERYDLLQPIIKAGLVPSDDFNLREVLTLVSLSEPNDPTWKPGGRGQRGHWMRLFACTVLVRLAPKDPACFAKERDTLVQFISSAIELGRPVVRAAACVLAWRFLAHPGTDSEDPPFLALAILLLAVYLDFGEDHGQWLKDLAKWVEDEESRAHKVRSKQRSSLPSWGAWLSRRSRFGDRAAAWRLLAHRILARPERPHPSDASETLQCLGDLVAGI